MATKTTTQKRRTGKAAEYRTKIAGLTEQLEKFRTDGYDPQSVAYLGALELGYSDRNAQLIAMQAPDATVVRGFKAWLALDRVVRKGEHGIQILAPAGRTADVEPTADKPEGEQGRQFFRLAYVFDIAQTKPIDESNEEK